MKNQIKKLSIQQYATKYGGVIPKSHLSKFGTITRQAILYRIKNNIPLPYVIECEQVGRSFVLTVLE